VAPWAAPLGVGPVAFPAGWASIPAREWKDGDTLTLRFALGPRSVAGEHSNRGHTALAWGPFVLARDLAVAPARADAGVTTTLLTSKEGDPLTFSVPVYGEPGTGPTTATFIPFADAGAKGGAYRVWLQAAETVNQ